VIDSAKAFAEGQTDGPPDAYYRLRHNAIMAYGGYRCACCDEGEPLFLNIDHVNNDGSRDRRQIGHHKKFWKWLQANGYPPGYQVLCSNCNHGKHRNGGTCPHKKRPRS
jgi:hypothetical protein